MVYFAKWKTKWMPENSRSNEIPGALHYEIETETGRENVYVPIERIMAIKRNCLIQPRKIANTINGYHEFERVELEQALRIAEKRGGDYITLAPFSEKTYVIYKKIPEGKTKKEFIRERRSHKR